MEIGPFKVEQEYENDPQKMQDAIHHTVFSTRNKESIDDTMLNQLDDNAIRDIEGTENDIIIAIDELKENSATGPDGILAIFLQKDKEHEHLYV